MNIKPSTRSPTVWQHAEYCRRKILGLGFPREAFYKFAQQDDVLRNLAQKAHGLRPTIHRLRERESVSRLSLRSRPFFSGG
ncbi:MAG: hypothetical protein ONB44_12300 [candidate division KSB1 bacterium]|nr:hypothetical protein [candidate division KSB1 bacterium]MDZ7302902.1 hypothetical protein [candidate division KSB1 bacterium]MDZ7310477.1 hypothetical protein [candidate division KSB1 bacterium]